jgi:hypothetical protein
MNHRFRVALASAIALAVLGSGPALAQSVRVIGDFNAWSAYSASEGAGAFCFAVSNPTQVAPTPDGFTEAYLYLTSRPAEGVSNEFNLIAGFSFAPDSTATVTVGGQNFELFTQGDAAWLQDAAQSENLAAAIRAGTTLTIEATTAMGIRVTETFSLSGATAASRAVESSC